MKLPLLRPLWPMLSPAAGSPDSPPEPSKPSLPAAWLLLHALFCATSMAVGFRFSRLIVYLLFLPTPINPTAHLVSLVSPPVMLAAANATTTITTTTTTTTTTVTTTTVAAEVGAHPQHHHHGPVFVGRHPIRVRPWPHPDPNELLKAHHILAAVQNAQRSSRRRGAGPPRPVIAVTPTTTSALQVPSLTSMAHTLRLVDGPLTWIVVEPEHHTDAVAAVLSRSNLNFLHITGPDSSTSRLRMHALREIRKRKMDGVVVFADENSILRTELFDEAQKVKSVGAVPVGVLGEDEGTSETFLQAPSCDAEGKLVGYHVSEETMLPANRGDMLLSSRLEWAGFVVNAQALWEGGGAASRPEWVSDIDAIDDGAAASPLSLVTDAARVEPLASCGQAALAWSHRSDALHEVKFPHEWKIDPPLVTIASRQQDAKPETPLKRTTLLNTEGQH
ncbi:probable glucuronosyltransferase Os04g0650300 [Oryza sativa Japonica Group]|jgi:hypothetical protein|uniref:Probable glucuronosyltransferase Os04g0650300 n=3 Tax=Oryza TaxID=4527 RepID=GT43_ORYSJ|nr:probable glucuronosyltransferase Os04g0650300 [Oryza sativa Japonica Group]B9FCV3.1 RecName: Full=Probable glucuronosyltransferase Os04g0650300; AltName: Full=OsGT43B [Oryza sativa Japonica Group]AHW98789.1 GT43 family glycosyltransferase I [Oryza sativa Japonica Group]EEE61808.1 hypothetical protein OsJ_16428 [Oryza sativa Japonica Group]KAF2936228.1 hypothetical protein DAI22_04g287800 [Oryza sativa Japonica Group]